jgi:hypothetical protein
MNKIKYFLHKYFSCCFLNQASKNIIHSGDFNANTFTQCGQGAKHLEPAGRVPSCYADPTLRSDNYVGGLRSLRSEEEFGILGTNDSHVKIITDNSPQNMTRNNSVDFRVYDKDDSNRNSNSNSNSVNIINSNRKKYIIPRSRSHSISPMDTPVNSFRVFSNSFVRTNSQCDLCRETSALTHSKIYCNHEPIINNDNKNDDKNDDNIIYF